MDNGRIGLKIISVFLFLVAIFYFLFGIFFSGFAFEFGSVMSGSESFVSESVLEMNGNISGKLLSSSAPVLSQMLCMNVFYTGLLMFLFSLVLFLVVFKMWQEKLFAIVFIILFSLFELFIVPYFLVSSFSELLIHLAVHTTIVIYLMFVVFSKK